MSNYPPGVTGMEPQITGDWPCRVCGGSGMKFTECWWCLNGGTEPEEPGVVQLENLAFWNRDEARDYVTRMAVDWLDRHDPDTRIYIRDAIRAVST
jgi:hypothetical protein